MSDLRAALAALDDSAAAPMVMGSRLPTVTHPGAMVPEVAGTMIVERLAISRVGIKVEVAAYIQAHFISRTTDDGTILNNSIETLIEDLTRLFHSIEQNSHIAADEGRFQEAAPRKASPRERPARGE